jgi:RNA polymerase sigma-70 factor (ECF subfamily)
MSGEVAEIALMMDDLRLAEGSKEGAAPSLALLIERAKAGDSTAFDRLMVLHQRKVISIAWRMLGNREDARDAAQEVFLRVYRYLGKYRPEQDFSGWLYRIAINVCRDMARKRSPLGQLASFEGERELGNLADLKSTDDVERAAILAQEQAIIARALETLSTKERAALVLRDFEGLSTEETARILDSSPVTVRSQICSARAKIKQYRDRLLKRRRQE